MLTGLWLWAPSILQAYEGIGYEMVSAPRSCLKWKSFHCLCETIHRLHVMTIKFPIFKPSYSQSWARPYSNITGSQAWWPTFKILFKVGEFIGLQFNKMENSWGVQSWHYHNCAIHLSLFDVWKIKCMFLIGFHKDLTFKPICSCWDTHMAIGLRGVSAWMPIRVVSTWTPHVQGVL